METRLKLTREILAPLNSKLPPPKKNQTLALDRSYTILCL